MTGDRTLDGKRNGYGHEAPVRARGTAPIAMDSKVAQDAAGAARAQAILLVDDEMDILESLKQLFEVSLKGVLVMTAESGPVGVKILKSQPIDLIITDFKMPGMNGLEFLAEARKIAPKTPRILVTAFPDLELAIKAVNDAKIENFFTKPVEPAKVVEIVRNILADRRAQELRDQSFARSLDSLRRQIKKE